MKEQIIEVIFDPQWSVYLFASLALMAILFAAGDVILILLSRFLRMPLDRGQWLRERLLIIVSVLFVVLVGLMFIKDRYNASMNADRILQIAGLPADQISIRFLENGTVVLAEKATAIVKSRTLVFERGPVILDVDAFPKAWGVAGGVAAPRLKD